VALQGDVAEHAAALAEVGASTREVRVEADLSDIEALVLPGGESTTMSLLVDSSGLREPLAARIAQGIPVFGTCAGMILLASEVLDGRPDQRSFGAIDISVRRNAFGRQVDSFETELDIPAAGAAPFAAVFIRAPIVERAGEAVEILAEVGGRPVLCRQGSVTVAAFHPELSADRRLHELFIKGI